MNQKISIADEILQVCQKLHQRNLLAAADGNVSVRQSDDEILITPTGVTKAFMSSSEVAVINLKNQIISGHPSSERLMHLEIYKTCPQAKAIVHAHPPSAIAWTLAFPHLAELPVESLPEVILACGRIPIVKYARPGTQDMGDFLRPYLPQCRALILSRHGAVCWGETLEEAYRGMERIEHVCLILSKALELARGSERLISLPLDEIQALRDLRKKIGDHLL